MSVRDTIWAAREEIMLGIQARLSMIEDPVVKQRAVEEFRRVEKFLGFVPGSGRPGA